MSLGVEDDRALQMRTIDHDLGVECTFCHAADDWKRDQKPQFASAAR